MPLATPELYQLHAAMSTLDMPRKTRKASRVEKNKKLRDGTDEKLEDVAKLWLGKKSRVRIMGGERI